MLFLLSFSLFLRVEVNKQIDRKRFLWLHENGSLPLCFDLSEKCHFFEQKNFNNIKRFCNETASEVQITDIVKEICPKDPDFSTDSSRVVLAIVVTLFVCFFLVKGFWVTKDYWLRAEDDKKYRKSTLLSRTLTLVATAVGIIFLAVAILADSTSISLEASQPLLHLDGGFVILQWALVLFAVYFSGVLVLKARCFRIYENKMIINYLLEPQTMMQILTLGPALLSVVKKNELMGTDNNGFINGLTSIAIAMAAGVLVIQIGNDGVTYFGQFATMFHLTLKKIPAHVFAVIYLLHGFSFGFWLLENRLATANEEQDFTDYWESIIRVFSMAFGLTEFNFEGPFKYNVNKDNFGARINIIFAYILILLMVLLVLLGLLNLLLSSIIRDHKEMKAEVAFNNILFMAQYAVWTDFYVGLWFRYFPSVQRWIGSETKIRKDKTVWYCRLPFCANAVKNRAKLCNIRCHALQHSGNISTHRHMEPHFDWVLVELNRRPELKKDKIESQVEGLVEQLITKVKQSVNNGDEEKLRIKSLHWDGIDWKMSFDQNVACSKRSTL